MRMICGADGCRGGWVAISEDLDSGSISWRLCSTARELAYSDPAPQVIALDIPIGLPERGPRACDLQARQLLGPGRASSVFPAPIRPVLAATSYGDACQIRFRVEGKKLSLQAWAIVGKIRDVDDMLRHDTALSARVREVHPEVSFYFLAAGGPYSTARREESGERNVARSLSPCLANGCTLPWQSGPGSPAPRMMCWTLLWLCGRQSGLPWGSPWGSPQ